MPTIRIPGPLRKLTGNLEEISVNGRTLKDALEQLNSTFPGLGERILDEQGEIRRFVNIFVNDEDVRFLQVTKTAVDETDVISIVPAIAGG
ncbi:MAG: MoaD/ThiS family protein [Proteobacteria bacterium]|jgi:sulfur-carrier protein|nr:MoaD/ThiS family protein [Pseudomonadota bacterium]